MAGHFKLAHESSRQPCSLRKCTNLGVGQDEFPCTDVNWPPSWLPGQMRPGCDKKMFPPNKAQMSNDGDAGVFVHCCLVSLGGSGLSCLAYAGDGAHPPFKPDQTPLGGLSLFQPDWMHTKSLVTDAYLLGSILLHTAKEVLPETPEVNIGVIWAFVQTFYTTNKIACRLSRLTLSMVDHQPFPNLQPRPGNQTSAPCCGIIFDRLLAG